MLRCVQLDGAFEYLSKIGVGPVDAAAFEQAAGVGVTVAPEDIAAGVSAVVEANMERLVEER